MSELLSIPYLLEEELRSRGIERLLQFCFDELQCSRSPPDSEDTTQFGYTTEAINGIRYDCSIDDAIDSIAGATGGTIWLWYDDLNVGIHIHGWAADRPSVPNLSLSVDEWYVKPWQNEQPALIHDFVVELYDYLSPRYVYGDTYLDESSLTAEGFEAGRLEEIYWVNGFGPNMADRIGRERLLHAPAWRVDDCADGGVFLWESPLPLSQNRQETDDTLRSYFDLNSRSVT
ncbi:hypothetical protein [Natronorubrum texcoconense]|uniref:Uncharacterized protein n=1 Tax=Natronorubrum texcoconense TaxID=1095776 RepID=A0A1G9GIK8_9EURY|nr:hypothetical protein [Natronorubrum texcoconense]SDL00514.1 hypothetical protein SAMN04515672_4521 [Natronorubrum texcoconense]